MVQCSLWSNATCASRNNCKTTFPKCSLCSRMRASLEMTSGRSCVSMPKNTTFSRNHASCLWVAFAVSRSYSPHHCCDGTSNMDLWWIECTKSSSMNEPNPCFRRFGESVSTARRAGDEDPDEAIIADTMKLLGNSGYGKRVTNVDRHRDVKYCTEIGTSSLINNKRFRQRDVVTDDAYEIEMKNSVGKYTLPLHIGFFVYQCAKLRMLQFDYDFVDRYVERPLFQYCEMDTDSAYIALAGESIDGLVRIDRRAHYFRHSSQWLPQQWLRRTRRRLCPCSNSRSLMDGQGVVLFRTQGFRQANVGSVQGRMVRIRIRRFVQQYLLLFWCHRQLDKIR